MHLNIPHPRGIAAFTLIEVMLAVLVLAVAISGTIGTIGTLDVLRRDGGDLQRARQVADYVSQALQGTNWDDLNDTSKKGAYLTWERLPDADLSGTIADDTNCLTDSPSATMAPDPPDTGLPMGLSTRRRLPFSSGLKDLRVYLEYYRAVSAQDSNGLVLMDGTKMCYAGLLQGSLVRTTGAGGEIWTIDPTNGDPSRIQSALSGVSFGERINGNDRIAPILIKDVDGNGDGVVDSIEPILLPPDKTITQQSGVTLGANDPVAARIIVSWIDGTVGSGSASPRRQFTIVTGLKR